MLFFAFEFLYIFLPIAAIVFYILGRLPNANLRVCLLWLIASSLVFYGYWNPSYLLLIGCSMVVNYTLGRFLFSNKNRPVFILAIAFNLGLISYFKYLGFFADIYSAVSGQAVTVGDIVLPLAISFFTFQQIAWVVDNYTSHVSEGSVDFGEYVLFVAFFPQLIAGPIVHHSEIIPQFRDRSILKFQPENFTTGVAIFVIGLFKKVVIADNLAPSVHTVFDGAALGLTFGFVDTWIAAIAFPMQVYFDFSGYADMAIGLALMFNIRLPINFESPFKSFTITEYWRRWHMTLSRFLRVYLYIPLGGSRRGYNRTYINVMITMLLGGLWHGAGWPFVFWGAAHGLLQVIHQLWARFSSWRMPRWAGWLLTLLGTTVAHSFFAAYDIEAAFRVLGQMFAVGDAPTTAANFSGYTLTLIGATFIGTLVLPSTRQLVQGRFKPIEFDTNTVSADMAIRVPWLDGLRIQWNWRWLGYLTALVLLTVYTLLDTTTVQEFIYFQF